MTAFQSIRSVRSIRPSFNALDISSTTDRTPNLAISVPRCFSPVLGLSPISLAISTLLRPSTIIVSVCRSRPVGLGTGVALRIRSLSAAFYIPTTAQDQRQLLSHRSWQFARTATVAAAGPGRNVPCDTLQHIQPDRWPTRAAVASCRGGIRGGCRRRPRDHRPRRNSQACTDGLARQDNHFAERALNNPVGWSDRS